ncbi:hypothetical protein PoB_007395600 [Plakobranchus ocellatus]|uniref:Uncharacterized protein n=1 Tax=Plakobranchus ocellatus TaxID=259542 RepID=A0AAV4DTQ0_9GAST|nr:hypothetical protein PoB_007395600 [Plakobranchus ocellatus]
MKSGRVTDCSFGTEMLPYSTGFAKTTGHSPKRMRNGCPKTLGSRQPMSQVTCPDNPPLFLARADWSLDHVPSHLPPGFARRWFNVGDTVMNNNINAMELSRPHSR